MNPTSEDPSRTTTRFSGKTQSQTKVAHRSLGSRSVTKSRLAAGCMPHSRRPATILFACLTLLSIPASAEIDFPNDFRATAVSSAQIDLAWEYGGADPIDGFRLYRSVAGGGTSLVAELGAESRNYSDIGLAPDTLYTYGLSAFREPDVESHLVVVQARTEEATASEVVAAIFGLDDPDPVAPGNDVESPWWGRFAFASSFDLEERQGWLFHEQHGWLYWAGDGWLN